MLHSARALLLLIVFLVPGFAQDAGWTVLSVRSVESKGGETFEVLPDASVLVSGPNPEASTYLITCTTDLRSVSAFRLEALTHDSLPLRGPGRAVNSHMVLTEFEASAHAQGQRRVTPISFLRTASDELRYQGSQPDAHGTVIDRVIGTMTGWVIDGGSSRQDRFLYLVCEKPRELKAQTQVTVKLVFDSGWAGHGLGRFRLSATAATNPDKLLPAEAAVAVATVNASIDLGVQWLLNCQAIDGTWRGPDAGTYRAGMTGLALYTLIKCGLPTDHPALRSGIAWLERERPTRTYDAGCTMMALGAFGDPKHKPILAQLAKQVVQSVGAGPGVYPGEWGYPGNHGNPRGIHADLSNTQYALLGLRAATHAGVDVDEQIWLRVSEWLCERQESYGGFGYCKGSMPTSSLTAAGTGCLLICASELKTLGKASEPAVLRAEAGARLGMGWLKEHWSVEQNVEGKFNPAKGADRWLYYWLYGLERVGSLSHQRLIGEHDWYQEGARSIVRRQAATGSWSIADEDSDTCFALLFLRRGTGTTAPAPRDVNASASGSGVAIGASAEWPPSFWVRSVGKSVEERLAKNEKAVCVRWYVNEAEVACINAPHADPRSEAYATRWQAPDNGVWKVQGRMSFVNAEGAACGEEVSAVLSLRVDSVVTARYAEAVRDAGQNLMQRDRPTIAVSSSERDGTTAAGAIDGRQTIMWLCDEKDSQPSLTLRLARPAQASVVKLGFPVHWPNGEKYWSRPRDVQVRINNEPPFLVRLNDDANRKHAISFPKTLVRTLKLSVLSTYAGSYKSTGFAEVELFVQAHPEDASMQALGGALQVIVPPGRENADVRWRYTASMPEDGWETVGFRKALGWNEGPGPFGVMPAGRTPARTAWEGESLWLREEFEVRQLHEGTWSLDVLADDTASIWINGVFAGEVPFTSQNYKSMDLSAEAVATLHLGQNLIAVHVKNTGGPGAVDVGLFFKASSAQPAK